MPNAMTKLITALGLSLALGLTACGNTDSTAGDTSEAAPSTASTAGTAGEPAAPAAAAGDDDTAASSPMPTGRLPAPEGASVYFISPADGDTVSGPVMVKFGLAGMRVAPAGMHKEGTGHHHLLVDVDEIPTDRPLPSNEQFIHFGGGQTETELDLEPGEHTLQLVLGDWKHQPHDPVVSSERITITVTE